MEVELDVMRVEAAAAGRPDARDPTSALVTAAEAAANLTECHEQRRKLADEGGPIEKKSRSETEPPHVRLLCLLALGKRDDAAKVTGLAEEDPLDVARRDGVRPEELAKAARRVRVLAETQEPRPLPFLVRSARALLAAALAQGAREEPEDAAWIADPSSGDPNFDGLEALAAAKVASGR
jgi:hypothetical protein